MHKMSNTYVEMDRPQAAVVGSLRGFAAKAALTSNVDCQLRAVERLSCLLPRPAATGRQLPIVAELNSSIVKNSDKRLGRLA